MAERVVYTIAKVRAKWKSGRVTIQTADGRHHLLLNCALPKDAKGELLCHPIDLICDRCGHGYSEQARRTDQPCSECHLEDVMERGAWLEAQGVPMGCGTKNVSERAGSMSRGEKQAMVRLRGKA